ncbi:hypothetical protein HPB51_001812 [Rhipicephalus microplus]|uniref:Nose resistant-to-fluoxetine protein N-terminal domain-containing protein n=1 Tax=Rhipicephalus microplus TaxID=6941 RepID=A0A9J6EWE5_RHIMP|nr:hypothetical protein HPB51_001812 [Rhipicephalus microplus]
MSILLESLAHASTAHNVSITLGHNVSDTVAPPSLNSSVGATEEVNYRQVLRDVVAAGLSKVPRSLVRKLLAAHVRFECSTALLRTMKALQNLEPWVLRLIDATGKYPSGAFELSRVDLGAFDECLETTVRDRNGAVLSRGQYCNLLIYVDNATAQQAILNSISDTLSPRQVLVHCWYLSADFQLFVVSLLTLLIFRRRNLVTLAAFAVLSLLGCAIATWTMARLNLLPFILIPFPDYARMMNTLNYYYILPFYHAVCYFSGCMMSLIVTDFGKLKISKVSI